MLCEPPSKTASALCLLPMASKTAMRSSAPDAVARDADHVAGGGDVQRRQVHRAEDAAPVRAHRRTAARKAQRQRSSARRADRRACRRARRARRPPAASCWRRSCGRPRRCAGRRCAHRAGVAEQLVEREAQVARALDGLALLRRVLQAADEAERVAEPAGCDRCRHAAGPGWRCHGSPNAGRGQLWARHEPPMPWRDNKEWHCRRTQPRYGQYRRTATHRALALLISPFELERVER